jgi:putative RNA 2'-phosphotransferase
LTRVSAKRGDRAGKFIAFLLRHDPGAGGLVLDSEGWTSVSALLVALAAEGFNIPASELEGIVEVDDKRRFALTADKKLIRANQGHSVAGVCLTFARCEPPLMLYHGTTRRALDLIRKDGLRKMLRHHVHLVAEADAAARVGARRGQPVILAVDARRMHADGHAFFLTENGVWLVDAVPPGYLSSARDPEDIETKD